MLRHIRVLDLTDERGFLAGKILGDLGADVIKVELPGGDPSRDAGPFLGSQAGTRDARSIDRERSLPWLALNTSKRGITLDLQHAQGRELFLRLVAESDVVLESFAPGTLADWGLGLDVLNTRRPGIIVCALTPFGQEGPWSAHVAHDLVLVALGGNMAMTGYPDRPPTRCSMPTSYYHAAPEAALGILMALHARDDESRGAAEMGRLVDVSMHECQLASLITGPGQYALTGRLGQRTGARLGRTREIWQAADGWISFGLRGGPTRIPNLIATVKYMDECGAAPDWLRDYDWQQYDHLNMTDEEIERIEGAFGAFFRTKTMRDLYEQALARRILLAPCNDVREIVEQAQLRDRKLFVTLDYPELGASIEHPDFFARSSELRIGIRRRAPRIGEHNAEIYGELGVDADEIARLRREGVI